ncbi:MAG: hypothetical protein GXO17_05980 [Thermodesulfobacteria bacterium]|nr:hypothetical protein [Thermodesulfobacteriota bacterium]
MDVKKIQRLEDVIQLAKAGQKIKAEVQLLKRPIILKIHPEAQIVEETEAYLLTAKFKFYIGDQTVEIERIYVMGFPTEEFEQERANINVANARLKEDYRRLKEAGIEIVEEKYFE